MDRDFSSPFIMGFWDIFTSSEIGPSIRRNSGRIFKSRRALSIASRVACSMFTSSIILSLTIPTPQSKDSLVIISKSFSLLAGESFLLSFIPSIFSKGGRIATAATTGPARGPLPASSMPATNLISFCYKFFS